MTESEFCTQCPGPFPRNSWPGSHYGGHWDTCPNRVASKPPSSVDATTPDPVNHPAHYTSGPRCECGRVIEAITITRPHTFARGNALKYLLRAGLKDPDRTAEDLQKAIWYITDELNQLTPQTPTPYSFRPDTIQTITNTRLKENE